MMVTIQMQNNLYEFDIDPTLDDDNTMMLMIYHNANETEICMFISPDEMHELARALLAAAGDQERPSVDEVSK